MRYVRYLEGKYFIDGKAKSWAALWLLIPILTLIEMEPWMKRIAKPFVAVGVFCKNTLRSEFPDSDEGFMMEMLWVLAAMLGLAAMAIS